MLLFYLENFAVMLKIGPKAEEGKERDTVSMILNFHHPGRKVKKGDQVDGAG